MPHPRVTAGRPQGIFPFKMQPDGGLELVQFLGHDARLLEYRWARLSRHAPQTPSTPAAARAPPGRGGSRGGRRGSERTAGIDAALFGGVDAVHGEEDVVVVRARRWARLGSPAG